VASALDEASRRVCSALPGDCIASATFSVSVPAALVVSPPFDTSVVLARDADEQLPAVATMTSPHVLAADFAPVSPASVVGGVSASLRVATLAAAPFLSSPNLPRRDAQETKSDDGQDDQPPASSQVPHCADILDALDELELSDF
jgi:hypothetical protein